MKYSKSKKFNIPKFLFIFVGLCSCVCALYIQETLSYFYTSYGFANTFQTPQSDSFSVYQKFTNPTPLSPDSGVRWDGIECTKELFVENTSAEGGESQYLRIAYPQLLEVGTSGDDYISVNTWSKKMGYSWGPNFNETDGFYKGSRSKSDDAVNDGWVQHGEWYYYKTPLPPGKKLQITDSMGNNNYYSKVETYRIYTVKFIVETLPSTVSDEDLKNTWGVSKSELGLS